MRSLSLTTFDKTALAAIGMLLLLIGATIWRGDHTNASATIDPAQAEQAAAAPSSEPESRIVYLAVDETGMNQLRLVEVNTAGDKAAAADQAEGRTAQTPVALTQVDEGVWDFTIDPTHTQVIYSALRTDGGADLWRVTPGKEAELFLACPASACASPAFSSDGALLAYSQRAVTGQNVAMINPPRLWLLDVATGESAALFSDSQQLGFDPAFSTDGKWLAYVSPQTAGVGLINLEDGTERLLPDGVGVVGAWRPDAAEIVITQVLTVGTEYPTHLVRYEAASGARVDLTGEDALVQDDSPAFSPDGQWIAFRRKILTDEGYTPGKQIWIMRADGSEMRALVTSAEHDHAAPQWSQDGSRLTFHRMNLRNAPIVLAAMVYDIESGSYWEVASPAQEPSWIR